MQKCSHCPSWCVWHFIHNPFRVIAMVVMFMRSSSVIESLETLFNPRHTFSMLQKKVFVFLKIPLRIHCSGSQVNLSYLCIIHNVFWSFGMKVPSVEMDLYLLRCSWNTSVVTDVKCSGSACLYFYSKTFILVLHTSVTWAQDSNITHHMIYNWEK